MLATVTMETEASHMLEAALEQMDDIIAASKAAQVELSNGVYELTPVVQLAEDLKRALDLHPQQEAREQLREKLPAGTAQTLQAWLHGLPVSLCPPAKNESYTERLLRLEEDKKSLVLQVSALTDQVQAQGEKIRSLESSLEEHRRKLASTEEMLQQELVSKTSLETHKLDLMDEVSYLKLKLVSMEDTHMEEPTHTQQNKAQCVVNLISELQEQMCRFQEEISTRIKEKRTLGEGESRQEEPPSIRVQEHNSQVDLARTQLSPCDSDGGLSANDFLEEMEQLRKKVGELQWQKGQYERQLGATKAEMSEMQHMLLCKDAEIQRLHTQHLSNSTNDNTHRDQEYQRLKVGMESLLASNDDKSRRIEELTNLLGQYRKINELMMLTHASSEEELNGNIRFLTHSDLLQSQLSSRGSSPLTLYSSPYQRDVDSSFQKSVDTSILATRESILSQGSWHQRRMQSSSLEELQSRSLQKKVPMEHKKYGTLPGKLSSKMDVNDDDDDDEEEVSPVNNYQRSLRHAEKMDESQQSFLSTERDSSQQSFLSTERDSSQQSAMSAESRKSHRGIKKLWGFIRRSQSGSPVQVHDPNLGDFKRGNIRASAGPRLAPSVNMRDLKVPFSKWSSEQTCDWLEDIGLSQYVTLARHWITSAQTLLAATPHELHKEMGMKNPLHRKKLQLAMKALTSKQHEKSAELDYIWVTRWLDDIGLPQYKDQFSEARVDGHMLQYLTVNDLHVLKVSSQLHHVSIKCAIHVLHLHKFHPLCLKRRPSSEKQLSHSEVTQWSNHRVMEWLRSVDLAEYAPNLRGSGVHGGLIMVEPRFNADTLATLLNIPPHKTLLRRHLSSNFNNLLGRHAQQEKRQYAEAADHSPLNITAKIKPKKLVFSNLAHLRRRRPEESKDYVCPVESGGPQDGCTSVNQIHILDPDESTDQSFLHPPEAHQCDVDQ
ncbi:liprin-beta-2-like isoform X2 [Entelurus aequoreus]|uniref:liprin-beta-2-like isoform X2 n=1 Tax=Entelurus aequoreus TaxID=161455 RepID=UPI002B1DE1ED|nr:liprin-beta-2-like isoform X2 [Entelurus aequoreus]